MVLVPDGSLVLLELAVVPWPGLSAHTGVAELQVTEQKGNSSSSGLNSMCKCPSRALKAPCTGNGNHREGEGGEEVDLVTEQASCLQGACLECQVRLEASQRPTQSLIYHESRVWQAQITCETQQRKPSLALG